MAKSNKKSRKRPAREIIDESIQIDYLPDHISDSKSKGFLIYGINESLYGDMVPRVWISEKTGLAEIFETQSEAEEIIEEVGEIGHKYCIVEIQFVSKFKIDGLIMVDNTGKVVDANLSDPW